VSEAGKEAGLKVTMMVRVAILTAVRLYGDGLSECLKSRANISVIGKCQHFSEIDALFREGAADVLLLDTSAIINLDDVRQLVRRFSETRVIAFALMETEEQVIAWAEAGVSAYVPLQAELTDLYATIFAAMRGEQTCPPRIVGSLFRGLRRPVGTAPSGERLTSRESETLRLMAHGYSNKQIAENLNISVSTVKNHVHTILEKLRVRTRAEAVAQTSGQRRLVVC
jgi:DNA-binding NarL/FixJ family response regulator